VSFLQEAMHEYYQGHGIHITKYQGSGERLARMLSRHITVFVLKQGTLFRQHQVMAYSLKQGRQRVGSPGVLL